MRAANTRYGTLYADNGVFAVASITAIPLVLGTNDIERARITSGGNLLVGTTTDIGQRLQVSGGYIAQVDGGVRTFMGYDGSGSLVGTTTNHYLRFITNDTERMRITSTGNVGIGTASPLSKLEVVNSAGSQLLIGYNAAADNYYDAANHFFRSASGASNRVFISGISGNVGIGTSSPSRKLTVSNAANGDIALFTNTADADLLINLTSGVTLLTPTTGILAFGTSNTERMRITSGGNVLIGTTTDNGAKLNVNGTIRSNDTNGLGLGSIAGYRRIQYGSDNATSFTLLTDGNAYAGLYAGAATFSSTLDTLGRVTITADSGNEQFTIRRASNTNAQLITGVHSSGYAWMQSIEQNVAYRPLVLNRDGGNVGIGTASPQKPLEAISNANDFVSVGVAQMGVGQWAGIHFGYRESNTLYRKSAIVFQRTDLTANDAQGKIHILNGPQGGAGSATLADARLTIAEDGNVGISTTNPSAVLSGTERVLEIANSNVASLYLNCTSANKIALFSSAAGNFTIYNTTAGVARLSITSGGNVLIGTTTDAGYTLNVAGNAQIVRSGTSTALVAGLSGVTGSVIRFSYNGGFVGSISTDGSNTAYNTSSDYRLKQDIKDFNGLDLLSRIKTYDFEWKSDKTRSYGVLAHELQEVINYAVHGSKDAEEMQGVDYSKLVPILIKAIQELNEKIK
jgi:hypothetical protein